MLIAQLEPPHVGQEGDHVYRTAQPMRALGALPGVRTVSGTWLSPAMRACCTAADLLVLSKVADPDLLPLLAARRAAGLTSVYEINDDFTDVQAWNATARFYASEDNRALLYQLASLCDGIQFSSDELQRVFGFLGGPQRVFHNQLWAMPSPRPRPDDGRLRVGWAGSYGHREDVSWMLPALRAAMAKHPQMQLCIMGDSRLAPLFEWAPEERLTLRVPGSLADYHDFVSGLDVGLAPLLDTGFNRGRSDVKFLEYAAHGVAPVCSAAPPYARAIKAGHALGFDSVDTLGAVLDDLLDGSVAVGEFGAQARAYVQDVRLERLQSRARLDFYEGLRPAPAGASDSGTSTAEEQRARRFEDAIDHRAPAYADSSYVEVTLGGTAKHLYNGLLSQQDSARARRDFEAALRAAPGDYLPHMHLGRLSAGKEARAALERALTRNPASVSSAHLLTLALAEAGQDSAAQRTAEALLTIAPNYAPARMWLAQQAQRCGQSDAAHMHLTRCVEDCPHYRAPRRALAGLALDAGDMARAEQMLSEGAMHAEPTAHDHYLMGRLHLLRGRADAACRDFSLALADGLPRAVVLPQLARARLAAGDREAARELLEELKQLHRQAS